MPGSDVAAKVALPASSVTVPPEGVVTIAPAASAGSATGSPTVYCVTNSPTPPAFSSNDHINGANLEETASWLSSGCQPEANTTTRPRPAGISSNAGSPESNFASTRAPGSAAVSIRR